MAKIDIENIGQSPHIRRLTNIGITKLDIRVPYDTNVDKVRKIIKKINMEIGQDEQMGPNLLDKIKSQGVREMDDSAMIMRVKFKTIPGEQFVIRREVYRRIQEEFAANGIEFAYRNDTVYLPPDDSQKEPQTESGAATAPSAEQKQKMLEAGAAAAAAIQAEEDAKQKMQKKVSQVSKVSKGRPELINMIWRYRHCIG